VRVKLPIRNREGPRPPFERGARARRALLAAGVLAFVLATSVFVYYYVQFSGEIDARLSGQLFNRASLVFSAPTPITPGEKLMPEDLASRLRKALYAENDGSRVGTYTVAPSRVEIRPGPLSSLASGPSPEGPVTVDFRGGRIATITGPHSDSMDRYLLEPEVITTLFDQSRTKRRVLRYQDVPPVLVNAVLAAEDRRFFSHHGVNIYRILAAAFKDIRTEEPLQGGSTLTMQLARNFFLTSQRTFHRKLEEVFLALLMEQRLTKEQIFELYSNQVYLGQRGSFSIDGLGEAADAYFNKDVRGLTLPEAALLAGLIRGPNLYSPYRHPLQACRVRNYVLREMQEDGFITADQARQASQAPLGIAPPNVEGSQAPFFVDMVKDQLLAHFSEHDLISQSYRIYTTLDPELQRAASEAVRSGMAEVDQQLDRRRRAKQPPSHPNQPQVALVVLDPHSGEVRALVGGRNYAVSQLNHAVARRQPGSSFKPFVYAAALSSAVDGSDPLVTPATVLMDAPTTFEFDDRVYEPHNYKEEYHGPVILREALSFSLNSATVSLAQMIGYEKVRDLAIAAGINRDLVATPALALGAYVATPLEITAAYTIFADGGEYWSPKLVLSVRDSSGHELWSPAGTHAQVLDPRVAYQMVNLLESVVNSGTGAGVRSRGFTLPAAGKTGTSHDGWFAGFTSNLLAVVWVGYDDARELNLSGASSALPVWTDFMKAATELPTYRDVRDFTAPPGVVMAEVRLPSGPGDPIDPAAASQEIFIEGTEPHTGVAVLGGVRELFSRLLHVGQPPNAGARRSVALPVSTAPQAGPSSTLDDSSAEPAGDQPEAPAVKKKPGIVKRFFSLFKEGKPAPEAPGPPPKSGDESKTDD
jgi:penicillin-binding protein 1B